MAKKTAEKAITAPVAPAEKVSLKDLVQAVLDVAIAHSREDITREEIAEVVRTCKTTKGAIQQASVYFGFNQWKKKAKKTDTVKVMAIQTAVQEATGTDYDVLTIEHLISSFKDNGYQVIALPTPKTKVTIV